MKTKKKLIALVQIAVVLCSVFLVAIPAIAAEQTTQEMQKARASTITTASEDDYVLGIYGNGNEDDTIDMGDVVYIKLAIFGKKPKTTLCDAKYDGRINVLDVIQTKLIILGKERELTFIDSDGDVVTVSKPVNRIIVGYNDRAELLRSLGAKDLVVGIDHSVQSQPKFFPDLSKLTFIGSSGRGTNYNYEVIVGLNPDVFLPIGTKTLHEEKLPDVAGIAIVSLNLKEEFVESTKKLGYMLDKKDEAEKLIDWYKGYLNKIQSRTEGLSDDEKPRVYLEFWGDYYACPNVPMCDIAGGGNIADDLIIGSRHIKVDPEWVIDQNPDIIVRYTARPTQVGYEIDDPSEVIALREKILNRPELANVNAVKNGNVYVIDMRHFGAVGGAGVAISTAYFAKWFHPDLFEDLDPQAIHQEYVTQFHCIDFNVYEHGVWVWPPLE